jgi:outer membrane protein OmpA-like peptidoglycan-associated protein
VLIAGGLLLLGIFLSWDGQRSSNVSDGKSFEIVPPQAGRIDPPMPLPPKDEPVSRTTVTSGEITTAPTDWSTYRISFDVGQEVGLDGTHAIQRLADTLHGNPDLQIKLEGYTDSTGSEAANRRVGLHRALTVKEALMDHGIEANRIHAAGPGEANPIATNRTGEGRAKNRRVEVSTFPNR